MLFQTTRPIYQHLSRKWTQKHRSIQKKLWDTHGDSLNWLTKNIPSKHIIAGSLGGLLLLSTPSSMAVSQQHLTTSSESAVKGFDKNVLLSEQLTKMVPQEMRSLNTSEEQTISKTLSDSFDFKVTPGIDGVRLNRAYGMIGGEQHLYRYPGDNLHKHADTSSDWAMYGGSGIAPGLGAWGYFTPSEAQFTEKDKLREKYYIAVQTFLAPGFAENVAKYRDFFKFRKMLLVNPKTGQAVVTVIGDAGPAEYTGKHLGGSPEVMEAVGLAGGPRKGAVLYFFIDDPNDQIPLGPISAKGGVN
ncbi:MAG: hypothetical protein Q7R49_05205 [Candidatus Daviesbacteria bacterium]|nr:hypothetical protein [Candidatus Daviesbacteria bacterium]